MSIFCSHIKYYIFEKLRSNRFRKITWMCFNLLMFNLLHVSSWVPLEFVVSYLKIKKCMIYFPIRRFVLLRWTPKYFFGFSILKNFVFFGLLVASFFLFFFFINGFVVSDFLFIVIEQFYISKLSDTLSTHTIVCVL